MKTTYILSSFDRVVIIPFPPVKIIKIPGFQGIHNSHLIQWPAVHIRIQAFGIYLSLIHI